MEVRRSVVVAALGLMTAAGVAHAQAASSGTFQTGGIRAGQYRVQVGDVLQYRVWPNAEASGAFPVESSGVVFLPMAGAVTVGGKTLDQVRTELRELYSRAVQGAIQPVVTVSAIFPFSVTGGVTGGGLFEGRAGMTLFDAVSVAGGFQNSKAPSHVDVVHADGTTTRVGGTPEELTAQLMQSQDRISVPVKKAALSMQTVAFAFQMILSAVTLFRVF